MKRTVVTITGPSCSGKSTLAKYLSSVGIPEVKSFTTRPPRANEDAQGFDSTYIFVTREFAETVPDHELIERVEFAGNYYGNTISQLDRAFAESALLNPIVSVVVEPSGVDNWKKASKELGFDVFTIYLDQSKETVLRRYLDRLKSVSPDRIIKELDRLKKAVEEECVLWPTSHNYDLTVYNLGERNERYSPPMIAGHLLISLG